MDAAQESQKLPRSQREAKARGMTRFFNGKPCPQGHVDERRTSNGSCVVCQRAASRQWERKYPDKKKAQPCRSTIARRRKERVYRGLPHPTRPEPVLCECCGRTPGKRGMHLDHDHKTGLFRGWLCHVCNNGIGMLGDSIEGLHRAIEYLLRHVQGVK